MSETETEREIEIVAGVIEGVTQKKPDTWQVAVKPDGSQYTKNLWTKNSELVTSLTAKLGQSGAFVCSASYWTNTSGTQVRSLWINGLSDGSEVSSSVPASGGAETKTQTKTDTLTKDEWARKDSAANHRACIAIAVGALTHTMPADPTPEDLRKFIERTKTLSHEWHRQVEATRAGDDSDVPFLSAHDEEIPY